MKTKVLLLTVALGAAGVATSMAQVFSQNAVGYVNVTIPAGKLDIIANQLNSGNNSLAVVLPNPPDGTVVYDYLPNGTYDVSTYIAPLTAWLPNPNISMAPGRSVFIGNSDLVNPLTLTFVGEVPQGSPLSWPILANLSLSASAVPQAGSLTTVLGFPPSDGDICYTYIPATGQYDVNTYIAPLSSWLPAQPNLAVGQGFFISTGAAKSWVRTFTVN